MQNRNEIKKKILSGSTNFILGTASILGARFLQQCNDEIFARPACELSARGSSAAELLPIGFMVVGMAHYASGIYTFKSALEDLGLFARPLHVRPAPQQVAVALPPPNAGQIEMLAAPLLPPNAERDLEEGRSVLGR